MLQSNSAAQLFCRQIDREMVGMGGISSWPRIWICLRSGISGLLPNTACHQILNILLCSAEPGWFNAENEEERSFRTMSYAAWIAKKTKRNLKIPIVLSGDTHHYSRYAAHDNSVHFITSGGGGAFLHGTHSLKREIQTENWIATQPRLLLNTEPGIDHKPSETDACYPSKRDSQCMLWKNLLFATKSGF